MFKRLPVKLGSKFVNILSAAWPRIPSDVCCSEPRLQSVDPFGEELDLHRQICVPKGKAEIHDKFRKKVDMSNFYV